MATFGPLAFPLRKTMAQEVPVSKPFSLAESLPQNAKWLACSECFRHQWLREGPLGVLGHCKRAHMEANLCNQLPEKYLTGLYASCTRRAQRQTVTIPQQKPILGQPQDLGILQHLATSLSAPSGPQSAGGWLLALSPGALGAKLGWAGLW